MSNLLDRFRKKVPVFGAKDSTYYERENLIKDIEDLSNCLNPYPSKEYIRTINEILFNSIALKNITINELKSKFGVPTCLISNADHIKKHKVYFYRESLGAYRILSQYHFINGEFVMASNRFSSQSRLAGSDKNRIVGHLQKKYLGTASKVSLKDFDLKYQDTLNNRLFVNDDVHFYLNYIPGSEFVKRITETCAEFDASDLNSDENNKVLSDLI